MYTSMYKKRPTIPGSRKSRAAPQEGTEPGSAGKPWGMSSAGITESCHQFTNSPRHRERREPFK